MLRFGFTDPARKQRRWLIWQWGTWGLDHRMWGVPWWHGRTTREHTLPESQRCCRWSWCRNNQSEHWNKKLSSTSLCNTNIPFNRALTLDTVHREKTEQNWRKPKTNQTRDVTMCWWKGCMFEAVGLKGNNFFLQSIIEMSIPTYH